MYRTALARTHRPRRFAELVGQNHVAATLAAAVEGGRVAHAYLFCGPRGIGKTTTARILAMALNCPEREGGEPCGTCESCRRIWSGQASLDVVEIDAASHRGVDDARDLRERAMYAPTSDERFKVYILDEAHMLTRDAWNALLKILEEPPPRVIFVFATTEPQKIEQGAAPVLSRCQRFDFRRVSVSEIVGRLREVLEAEGVEFEDEALLSIARRADGGVRDALSLLDQVLSFSADQVKSDDVHGMLGLVEEERFLEFFEMAERGDRGRVFPFVQELLDAGYDSAEFVRGLADATRMLLILRSDPESRAVDLLPESRERFASAAQAFSEADLLRQLTLVSDFETSRRMHRSSQQRVQLEVLLLRLVSMDASVTLEELLAAAGGAPEWGEGVSPAARAEAGRTGGSHGHGGAGDEGAPESQRDAEAPDEPEGDEGAPAAAGGEGPRGAGSRGELRRAWLEALNEIPSAGGQMVALRGARIVGLEGGTLTLHVPAGLARDVQRFLSDRTKSAPLRERLATELGVGEVAIEVEQVETARRLTAEDARNQKLSQLMDRDPGLKEAVEKLDLRLKE